MATRDQVRTLLDDGLDYPSVGEELSIPPGQAYLIATGRPADGSGTAADADPDRPGNVLTSPQRLSNPASSNPTSDPAVHAWVRRRASTELARPR